MSVFHYSLHIAYFNVKRLGGAQSACCNFLGGARVPGAPYVPPPLTVFTIKTAPSIDVAQFSLQIKCKVSLQYNIKASTITAIIFLNSNTCKQINLFYDKSSTFPCKLYHKINK